MTQSKGAEKTKFSMFDNIQTDLSAWVELVPAIGLLVTL